MTSAERKVDPESLILRGKPRRVVRFKRNIMIGAAACGFIGIVACGWIGLSKPHGKTPADQANLFDPEQAQSAAKPLPDPVQNLPASYAQAASRSSGVPQLGPPLPGDLGKTMLEHQQAQLAASATVPAAGTNSVAQSASAAATTAGVFVRTADGNGRGDIISPSSAGSDGMLAASPAPLKATSQLTLDLDKDQNNQGRKLDFVGKAAGDGIYNVHDLQMPKSPYEVLAGTIISASLITGLDSDLPGTVIGQVTENVYDTVTGRILLIPQGTRLIGQYDSVVAFGQSRALLVWQRLILPDGSSLQIDNLPATDMAGYTGLSDKVDYRTWALLKGVGMATLLGVTAMSGGRERDSDLIRAIRESAEQSANQAGEKIVEKHLNVQPVVAVRPGWPLRVIVHKDLVLRPYGGGV